MPDANGAAEPMRAALAAIDRASLWIMEAGFRAKCPMLPILLHGALGEAALALAEAERALSAVIAPRRMQ